MSAGHICFFFEEHKAAFVGDTLFSLGCGRLFEGTPAQMWNSLQKLLALPDETLLHCAHEYTESNANFAVTLEPENPALKTRIQEVIRLRAELLPTVPTTLGLEKATNPFLRPDSLPLQRLVGLEGANLAEVFAEIRHRKDIF